MVSATVSGLELGTQTEIIIRQLAGANQAALQQQSAHPKQQKESQQRPPA
jgi:hypothetical protein